MEQSYQGNTLTIIWFLGKHNFKFLNPNNLTVYSIFKCFEQTVMWLGDANAIFTENQGYIQ